MDHPSNQLKSIGEYGPLGAIRAFLGRLKKTVKLSCFYVICLLTNEQKPFSFPNPSFIIQVSGLEDVKLGFLKKSCY